MFGAEPLRSCSHSQIPESSAHLLLLGIVRRGERNSLHITVIRQKTMDANAVASRIAEHNATIAILREAKSQFGNGAIEDENQS
jgi:hypothetical protein